MVDTEASSGGTTEQASAVAGAFVDRWKASGAAERANYVLFLSELCDLLAVPRPQPTQVDETLNAYVFEKTVVFRHADGTTSPGRIDLYKQGCFVLEAKQGKSPQGATDDHGLAVQRPQGRRRAGTAVRGTRGWDDAMLRARGQAEQYARALPEWPPFLVVVDVGHSIELFSDFEKLGKCYLPFPDARSYRISIDDLRDPGLLERLRLVWTDPSQLDPGRYAARVTRVVAGRLAALARSLEKEHPPHAVADFLMRCLFTMFAEDVGLLPQDSFTNLLGELREQPASLARAVGCLWGDMDRGDFSPVLRTSILRFNGRFFKDQTVLPLTGAQIDLLIEAAEADWSHVEPAIFGTLVERALDPTERHKLGAHYTPRAYVERLVMPTLVEPLRREWDAVRAAALALLSQDTPTERAAAARRKSAVQGIKDFHARLCALRVLDPACGTGNFLYVSLEHIKRLEGEVLQTLEDFGEGQQLLELPSVTVDPHQFLGIEVNPRAAAIAELVLWIGYLQWHFRTHGRVKPPEPVLRDFHNIECRDALLAYDREEPQRADGGKIVTQWDGETTKPHPVSGKPVPDETARRVVYDYVNARRPEWPTADFVVSNPPFLGTKRMRAAFGDGYVDALRAAFAGEVEDNADFVMYWWHAAARLLETGSVRRFGFITTNSIGQSFNRRVLASHLAAGVRIVWAIPDHPWVDSATGAAVRIAMTCASTASDPARLECIGAERVADHETGVAQVELEARTGAEIGADLGVGADVTSAVALQANRGFSGMGVALHGAGFILTPEEAAAFGYPGGSGVIRPYLGGRDLLHARRERYVIDFSFLTEDEARSRHPAAFQRVVEQVLPERKQNRRKSIRELWWRFGWERPAVRKALAGLPRYIATTETAKHRVFQFVDAGYLPDHMIIVVASDDAALLGVLSSRVHVTWALAAGGRLGVGNDPRYNKSRCFDPFPFPAASAAQQARIRECAEALDAHRKRQQAAYADLTLTDVYNVMDKLRAGEPITSTKHRRTHEQGLCSVLLKLHDDLDAAVSGAYGWPNAIAQDELLERLVALNAERAQEERRGLVRWLRPDYQRPGAAAESSQPAFEGVPIAGSSAKTPPAQAGKPWPRGLVQRVQAVREALDAADAPLSPEAMARVFRNARTDAVTEILDTLSTVGQARRLEDGRYAV